MKALIRCHQTDDRPDPDPGVRHRAGLDLDPDPLLIQVFLLDQGGRFLFRLPLCYGTVSLEQEPPAGCVPAYAQLELVYGRMLLASFLRSRLSLLGPGR